MFPAPKIFGQKKSSAGRAVALSRAATFLTIKVLRGTRPFSLASQKSSQKNPASPNPDGLSIPNTLVSTLAREPCHCDGTCPRFLSLQNVPLGSCHCETCRIHGAAIYSHAFLAREPCHSRWSEKIFLRSLNVSQPRATLVAWWKQSPHKQHLIFGLLRYARNDKSLDRRTAFAMTIRTAFAITTLNLSLRWNVETEAISLQFLPQVL